MQDVQSGTGTSDLRAVILTADKFEAPHLIGGPVVFTDHVLVADNL